MKYRATWFHGSKTESSAWYSTAAAAEAEVPQYKTPLMSTACEEEDMVRLRRYLSQASHIWHLAIEAAADERVRKGERRDVGTCVLGAGLGVYFLAPGETQAEEQTMITPPCRYQGSMSWKGIPFDVVKLYLKCCGFDAHYIRGRMD